MVGLCCTHGEDVNCIHDKWRTLKVRDYAYLRIILKWVLTKTPECELHNRYIQTPMASSWTITIYDGRKHTDQMNYWPRLEIYQPKIRFISMELSLDSSTAGPPDPNLTMRPRQHALLVIRSTVLQRKLAATLPRNSQYLWKPGTLPLISVTTVKVLPSYFFQILLIWPTYVSAFKTVCVHAYPQPHMYSVTPPHVPNAQPVSFLIRSPYYLAGRRNHEVPHYAVFYNLTLKER